MDAGISGSGPLDAEATITLDCYTCQLTELSLDCDGDGQLDVYSSCIHCCDPCNYEPRPR